MKANDIHKAKKYKSGKYLVFHWRHPSVFVLKLRLYLLSKYVKSSTADRLVTGIFKQFLVICDLLGTQDCKYKHAYILPLCNEAICRTYVIPNYLSHLRHTQLFVAPTSYPVLPSKTHEQKNSGICNNRPPLHVSTVYLKSPWAEFYRWLYTFSQK
jgi:hypothetical protein